MTAARGKTRHTIRAGPRDAGERLDRLLAEACADLSRTRVKALIEAGLVSAEDGVTIVEPSYRVKPGQTFAIIVPEARPPIPKPQAIGLDVVYEDAHLIVIDKPAGMVVHPAPGNPDATLVNALIAHCGESLSGIGGVRRPGIVHRLDKDTSGLMVVARSRAAMDALVAMIAARDVSRQYLALAHKAWGPRKHREVDAPIGRDPRNRLRMAVVDLAQHAGKTARTDIDLLAGNDEVSLVRCTLHTGRTHQIRVHMASKGSPCLADPVYGASQPAQAVREMIAAAGLKRQALHAAVLGFVHPVTGQTLRFETPLPADMATLQADLETL